MKSSVVNIFNMSLIILLDALLISKGEEACNCDRYKEKVQTKKFTKGYHLGCFQDQDLFRLLNGYFGTFSKTNTPENCVDICHRLEYKYAGVQYGEQCFCGDREPTSISKLQDSSCNSKCTGNSKEFCGGNWSISIYETGIKKYEECEREALKGRPLGCYRDQDNFRLLNGISATFKHLNSPEYCVNWCSQSGYEYAGVQFETECFCGNKKPSSMAKLDDPLCDMKCPANFKPCGGGFAMNIFETGIKKVLDCKCGNLRDRYMGCYKDGLNPRLLNGYYGVFKETNSPQNCLELCFDSGFLYAGVQYGNECFCSDNEPPTTAKIPESSCNMSCPKIPLKCGGYGSMNIYKTGIMDKKIGSQNRNAIVERISWNCPEDTVRPA